MKPLDKQELAAMSITELGQVAHEFVKQAQLQKDFENREADFEEVQRVVCYMKFEIEQRQFPGRVENYISYKVDNALEISAKDIEARHDQPAQESMRLYLEKTADEYTVVRKTRLELWEGKALTVTITSVLDPKTPE